MALAIDILQSFVIERPLVEIDRGMRPLLEIVANIVDRSHLGPIATNRTIQKSYGAMAAVARQLQIVVYHPGELVSLIVVLDRFSYISERSSIR